MSLYQLKTGHGERWSELWPPPSDKPQGLTRCQSTVPAEAMTTEVAAQVVKPEVDKAKHSEKEKEHFIIEIESNEEGEEKVKYKCKLCDYENEKERGMKQHVTKAHKEKPTVKRKLSGDLAESTKKKTKEDEEETAEEVDDNTLEEIVREKVASAEERTEEEDVQLEDALQIYVKKAVKVQDPQETSAEKIDEAVIKERDNAELKQDNEELKAKVASLEEAIEVKDDRLNILQAKNDTLEIEAANKGKQNEDYKTTLKQMLKDMNVLKERKGDTDKEARLKMKKVTEEAKEKEKRKLECEKKLEEMTKKVGEEANMRVKAEADLVRSQKQVDHLMNLLGMRKGQDTAASESLVGPAGLAGREERWSRTVCRDLSMPGGCKFGAGCRYFHPAAAAAAEARRVQQQQQGFPEARVRPRGVRGPSGAGAKLGQQPLMMYNQQRSMVGQHMVQHHQMGQQQQMTMEQQQMAEQQQMLGQQQQMMGLQQPMMVLPPMVRPMVVYGHQGWPAPGNRQ